MPNALTELAQDLASQGLRFDLNPTHMFKDVETSETFWHQYIKRADDSVRERARDALEEAEATSAELERENDLLRQHAADKISHATLMTGLNINNGGVHMGLEGGACQLLIESFADQFSTSGATNYLELTFVSQEKMPGVRFVVTVQRVDGETPTEQIKKLKAQLAELPICSEAHPASAGRS